MDARDRTPGTTMKMTVQNQLCSRAAQEVPQCRGVPQRSSPRRGADVHRMMHHHHTKMAAPPKLPQQGLQGLELGGRNPSLRQKGASRNRAGKPDKNRRAMDARRRPAPRCLISRQPLLPMASLLRDAGGDERVMVTWHETERCPSRGALEIGSSGDKFGGMGKINQISCHAMAVRSKLLPSTQGGVKHVTSMFPMASVPPRKATEQLFELPRATSICGQSRRQMPV